MRRATSILIVSGLLASTIEAAADSAVGASGLFRKAGTGAYLMIIDWDYVPSSAEADGHAAVLLNDENPEDWAPEADDYDVMTQGHDRAKWSYEDRSVIRFTGSESCDITISGLVGNAWEVRLKGTQSCNPYRSLEGIYTPVWQAEN